MFSTFDAVFNVKIPPAFKAISPSSAHLLYSFFRIPGKKVYPGSKNGSVSGKTESLLDISLPGCYYTRMESLLSIKSSRNTYQAGFTMKNRLEELRKSRGIKQEELASALEVSRQTIGSLENGRYNPSILLAFRIARYFGMNIEDIFIYEEDTHEEKK